MAAKVEIKRWTGSAGSPLKTDITDERALLSTSDDPDPGASNPIPLPGEGDVKRSFWMTVRLHAKTPPSGKIDNIKWFADGMNNFGPGVGKIGQVSNSYVQATGTEGESGDELSMANHAGLAAEPQDVFSWDEENPLSIEGELVGPETGDFGQFFVAQMFVEYDIALEVGLTPSEMFVFVWDET